MVAADLPRPALGAHHPDRDDSVPGARRPYRGAMPGVDMTERSVPRALQHRLQLGPLGRRRAARGSESPHPRSGRRRRAARSQRGHGHAQPAAANRGRDRRARARRPPHDDADRRRHRVRVRALRKGLRRRRLPQRRAQPHRRLLPRGLRRLVLRRQAGRHRSPRRARRRARSTSSRTGWSAAAFCSTCRAYAASPGSSPATTSSARTSRRRSASRACGWGPATSCSSAPVTRGAWPSSSPGTPRKAKAGCTPPRRRSWRTGEVAALGSDGNSDTAPSTTEGVGFPDPRPRDQRHGRPPARLPPVRGRRAALRGRPGAGSSCSSPLHCGSSAGRGRRSIRSRSSDAMLHLRIYGPSDCPGRDRGGPGGARRARRAWRSPTACGPGTSCSPRRSTRSRRTRCSSSWCAAGWRRRTSRSHGSTRSADRAAARRREPDLGGRAGAGRG